MEIKELFIKAVGVHKENYEKTYNYVAKIQDQAETKLTTFVQDTAFIPEPVKQVYVQWNETARNIRDAFKKYTDEGYQGIVNYLATTA